ncbi:hypothetical protein E0Z10_g10711 [Xylaria hypoxylon]|uniref:Uncharacterized protein n=1 Tax=Xylaria hypoxylon TaxID=37992 RepID=A0A4Z0Y107_9PEZI|nr:hypothetical protein E0Z10_g10711 [Xylaria hypoxylon]
MRISFITENTIKDDTSATNSTPIKTEDDENDEWEWQRAWEEFGIQLDGFSRIMVIPYGTFERLGDGGWGYFQMKAGDILNTTPHFFLDASNDNRVYLADLDEFMDRTPCVMTHYADGKFPVISLRNNTAMSLEFLQPSPPPTPSPPMPSHLAELPWLHSNPPTPINHLSMPEDLYNDEYVGIEDYVDLRADIELDRYLCEAY